jgi:3-hydroxy-3-methylglutaryl CoA synthase/uncharacterized OB-fold protein
MAGISAYGAYIPFHRLSRAEIARAWEAPTVHGERAIASYDEDSLTMGVEAALDCTKDVAKESIDGLLFASTSSPYKDKQSAATIAMVLGLNESTVTMDLGGSFRSGTNALRAALDMVKSGSAKKILVIASELRLAYPSGPFEMNFGDGAVAVLVSDTNVIAEIENTYSVFEELQDIWRSDRDIFPRSAEDRFMIEEGFNRIVPRAVSDALKKFNLTQKDYDHCVLYVPSQRQVPGLVRKLGFDPKTQSRDALFAKVGDAGAAMALMLLVETLEGKTGPQNSFRKLRQRCDVFSIRTSAGIDKAKGSRQGVQGYSSVKAMLSNYNRYLRWHGLVLISTPGPLEIRQPVLKHSGERTRTYPAMRGTKCKQPASISAPAGVRGLRTKDDFEYYSFVDKKAKIYTFSHDFVMQTADPPVTIAMVDFEGGGRMMCDVTDRHPDRVKVGMPVEMTFRKLYYVGGIYNYWWKARAIR